MRRNTLGRRILEWFARSLGVMCLAAMLASCGEDSSSQQIQRDVASAPPTAAAGGSPGGATNACALLTDTEVQEAVGNPVTPGAPFTGSADCEWETENPEDVSVLVIAHRTGSIRAPILCDDLRKKGAPSERVEGWEVASWKFSKAAGLFYSGELECCGPKGFVSLQLNGRRDEPELKRAALTMARKLNGRL